MRPSRWTLIVMATALILTVRLSLPVAHAISCEVKINSVNYPLKAAPGQSVEVTTQLTATCTHSAIGIAGRSDLVDPTLNQALSTKPFFIGYVPKAQGETLNLTVSQAVQAHSSQGIWQLRLEIRLSVGEGTTVVGFAEQPLTVLVGENGQTAITSPISLNQSGNASQAHVQISSNSTVTDLHYDASRNLINFTVDGPPETNGLTSVIFEKTLVRGSPAVVIDNGNTTATAFSATANATHYLLTFAYPHSMHTVAVGGSDTITEFDPLILLLVLPVLIAAASVVEHSKCSRDH